MPPPLRPRHLRPSQPSWGAHRARCAKPPTTDHDHASSTSRSTSASLHSSSKGQETGSYTPKPHLVLPNEHVQRRGRESPPGESPIKTPQHHVHTATDPSSVFRLASRSYRLSTALLMRVEHQIEKELPGLGLPLAALIRQRLSVVAQEAIAEGDLSIIQAFGVQSGGRFKHLLSETLQMSHVARSYRQSVAVLAQMAQELEQMASYAAAATAAMIRHRLGVIAAEADAEKDYKMRQNLKVLKAYRVNTKFSSSANASISEAHQRPVHAVSAKPSAKWRTMKFQPQTIGVGQADNKIDQTLDTVKPGIGPMKNTIESNRDVIEPRHQLQVQSHSTISSDRWISRATPGPKGAPYSTDRQPPSLPPQHPPADTQSPQEQSLLEELFPEMNPTSPTKPANKRDQYPKLNLPEPDVLIRSNYVESPRSLKEQVVESLRNNGEGITVLQLEHCSTGLTEADFRRVIPKGKHIETWNRGGEFYKVIPGRNPLSLERLPFYYLLFKSPESALAYQKNASRLHKLAALHQSSSILSPIHPPKGFLEDGEDIGTATASYLLKPPDHRLTLSTIMQPYHPALRALFQQGGYKPIVPDVDAKGTRIYKVLMHIEGYEPSKSDLFKIISKDAYTRGVSLSLYTESSASISRLRDVINLKTHTLPMSIASANPRAYGQWDSRQESPPDVSRSTIRFDDPTIAYLMRSGHDGGDDAKGINQMVMNRVYNRWLIEFDVEDSAKRFAIAWHRRVLPHLTGDRTWKDYEEVRMCNCEFLW